MKRQAIQRARQALAVDHERDEIEAHYDENAPIRLPADDEPEPYWAWRR